MLTVFLHKLFFVTFSSHGIFIIRSVRRIYFNMGFSDEHRVTCFNYHQSTLHIPNGAPILIFKPV